MDRKERLEGLKRDAEEVFSEHVLQRKDTTRWVIQRPKRSEFWAEIMKLEGGKLLIHGDIDPVIFAYYSGGEDNSPEAVLQWVANMWDSPSYAQQKASIGSSSRAYTTDYDPQIAASDIQFLIDQYVEEFTAEEGGLETKEDEEIPEPEVITGLKALFEQVDTLSAVEMWNEIYEVTGDVESSAVGDCIAPRVVYAVAAVRRLVELRKEE